MATTKGLVQRIKTGTANTVWVYIGAAPTQVQLLFVPFRSTLSSADLVARSSMVDALTTAMMVHREVSVSYGDDNSEISTVTIEPV